MRIVLLLYCLPVCLTQQVDFQYLAELKEDDINETDLTNVMGLSSEGQTMNGSVYKSVKKYYCRAPRIEYFILFGTKAWTFPAQDVSLNLEYPSKNFAAVAEHVDYILTELTVILRQESRNSRGYITSGGMLQDNISMTFVFDNITSLSYEFYLYGIHRRDIQNLTDNYAAVNNLC